MKLETLAQKSYFGNQLKKHTPLESKFERFKEQLRRLLKSIDETESEGHNETLIKTFLDDSFYKSTNHINKKDRKDYVIHSGNNNTTSVDVILEIKKPHSSEMISKTNPNRKALQQLVLYYLRERIDEKNTDIKNLIATDVYNWFVFDANEFEKAFGKNTKLIKAYKDWRDNKKVSPNTDLFYKEIAQPFIENLESLECVHFDIRDYQQFLDKDDEQSKIKISRLYKLFSPKFLLKESFADDSNKLDKNFYNELLHIIGLEEVKENNKLLIQRKSSDERDSGSLIELAIAKLETEYARFDFDKIKEYGDTKEERIYNIALELCITWINRILFLRLLEAQLVNYHKENQDFLFLNFKIIGSFSELYTLFHNVLAVKLLERSADIKEKFTRIPYLNSSLFDFATVENDFIQIDKLTENKLLTFNGKTILKAESKNADGLPTLEYLFKFLDKYDFATVETKIVREDDRKLINASILGKVFEKINGYKDGAVFTPAFITMYMCRQAIRLAVLQKFKDATDFDSEDFEELKIYIGKPYKKDEIKKYNEIIDGLKLCDPAVGSGHFLVSALNEIIAIKSELHILASGKDLENEAESYRPIRDKKIAVVDDELDIRDEHTDEVFEYEIITGKPSDDAQFIQKTLFHEKQKLIENSLFGVDINPNSVKICRLRLWIELLKNAYYRPEEDFTDLETLPNIDINIKEGNSLISRHPLEAKFSTRQIKQWIGEYRAVVDEYKNVKIKERKDKLEKTISNFHEAFEGQLEQETSQLKSRLIKQESILAETQNVLLKDRNEFERKIAEKKVKQKIDELKKQIAIMDAKYVDAFEWRYEFPEVLDEDGSFLGFDVVIGNPPYIRQEQLGVFKKYLKKDYEVFAGTADILVYFYELGLRILKQDKFLSFITSNKFMRASYGNALRNFLWKNNITEITDFGELPVFEEAATFPVIVNVEKAKNIKKVKFTQIKSLDFLKSNDSKPLEKIIEKTSTILTDKAFKGDNWTLADSDIVDLIEKIKSKGIPLEDYLDCEIKYGIKTGFNEAFVIDEDKRNELIAKDENSAEIIFPYAVGDDFRKYELRDKKRFIILTKIGVEIEKYSAVFEHLKTYQKQLEKRWDKGNHWWELRACAYYDDFLMPKIVYPDIAKESRMTFVETPLYFGNTAYFISTEDKYILALLNSNTIFFYYSQIASVLGDAQKGGRLRWFTQDVNKIPIPKISPEAQEPFIKLVDEILEKKKRGEATFALEERIDQMVYELYELTDEEIAIVEGSS